MFQSAPDDEGFVAGVSPPDRTGFVHTKIVKKIVKNNLFYLTNLTLQNVEILALPCLCYLIFCNYLILHTSSHNIYMYNVSQVKKKNQKKFENNTQL